MLASTTQDTLVNNQNDITSNGTLNQSTSTLATDDFNNFIEQQYGAWWGTFKFEDSLSDYSNDARPFIYVDETIDLQLLRQFMLNEWKLSAPNIVIPILSGISNHKPLKNLKMVESFKSGIKNAANASDVWFITNGLDIGMPQIIGSAFRDENVRRKKQISFFL